VSGVRDWLNRLAGRLLDFAVIGDPTAPSIRLTRRLLRVHPGLHLAYCYRFGRLREVLRIYSRRRVRGRVFERAVRRSAEMCAVLDGRQELVSHAGGGYRCEFNGRVLLAFHSSANFDPAGYTVRSNALVRAVSNAGVDVTACTRLGYPWDLAQHRAKPRADSSRVEGFRIHHFEDRDELIGDADSRYVAAYADRLVSLAEAQDATVIHAASSFVNGLAAAVAGRRLGIGSVYEMRGLWHLTRAFREPGFSGTEHFAYSEMMELEAARACDRVVVISRALGDWLAARGIDRGKIHLIPNAAELDEESGRSTAPAVCADGERVTVGFIGALTDYEGVDNLIRAVAILAPQIPGLRCIIVGDGCKRSTLERLNQKLKCRDIVRFTGRVPRDQVAKYYRNIDMFPLPRRSCEVCELVPPLKPLEIMAHCRPVIVSGVAPLVEMVCDGKTGLVVPPEDVDALAAAIKRLCRDRALRMRLAEQGRRWVETERNWAQNARLYLEMYRHIDSAAPADKFEAR
jgi:glycosyltransferase involved in cell wall biosynthesis